MDDKKVIHQGKDDMYLKQTKKRSSPLRFKFFVTAFLCLIFFSIFYPVSCFSDTKKLIIIKSEDNELYNKLERKIVNRLGENCRQDCEEHLYHIEVITAEQILSVDNLLDGYFFAVTLGVKAQDVYMNKNAAGMKQLALHALVPQHLSHHDHELQHYSLVLDQPIETILAAVNQLINVTKPVGIPFTANSEWRIKSISEAASKLGINIKTFRIETKDPQKLGSSLKTVLPQVSSIIMLPDKSLYNRTTINEILLTGYLNKVPFIGYSKALVKTGAFASFITSQNIIADDIIDSVKNIIDGRIHDSIIYPSAYKLIINEQIQQSLELEINPQLLKSGSVEVIR